MLEIKNLSISILDRKLIENLSFTLDKGDKLAIIGEEGNGKSTLLKALIGECKHAEIQGHIDFKSHSIGYLEQTISKKNIEKKVFDYLFENENEYYAKIAELYSHAKEMDLGIELLERRLDELSGGEKVKIGILKILLDACDILLLDEPTNDLDLDALKWLEKFINETTRPIIFVSHDEVLLSNTANAILHIEQIDDKTQCRHTLERTDYRTYVAKRVALLAKQTQLAKSEKREFEKKEEKLRQIMQKVEYRQNTISRQDPFGAKLLKKKMHTLKAQEKRLADKELTEVPAVEENINFFFDDVYIPKSKIVARIDLSRLEIAGHTLAKNISFDIVGDTHLCITGKNGTGKTTLLKKIYEKLKDRTDINVGYMPQDYESILNEFDTALDFIKKGRNKEEVTIARTRLGSMNFTAEETTGKISNLSNGSKAKLFLAKLALDRCNVLILDEPTRNLSPLSAPVLNRALKEFKGTIISVSHDRRYIEEVAEEVYTLTPNGIFQNKTD